MYFWQVVVKSTISSFSHETRARFSSVWLQPMPISSKFVGADKKIRHKTAIIGDILFYFLVKVSFLKKFKRSKNSSFYRVAFDKFFKF